MQSYFIKRIEFFSPEEYKETSVFFPEEYKENRRQILDSSNLKRFAADNFKFDENGRKLSKRVENTVGKG